MYGLCDGLRVRMGLWPCTAMVKGFKKTCGCAVDMVQSSLSLKRNLSP